MCGMCPANGELENGDPEAPVDFLCRVAHLRAHAFELPFGRHGDCEYCEGGVGHDELLRSAARLKLLPRGSKQPLSRQMLPMLQQRRRGRVLERRVPELQLTLNGQETEITMNDESQSERTAKRAYQKPELTQVSLKPEEAVLAVCKIAGRSGPAQARCTFPKAVQLVRLLGG